MTLYHNKLFNNEIMYIQDSYPYKFMREAQDRLINKTGTEVQSKHIEINKTRIHYVTTGQGTPLLLIHGANIGWGQWYTNIFELSKYFKVYAIDLPGSGLSSGIDYKKLDFDIIFVNLIDEFILKMNLKNLSLIGHSLGGWIVLKLALNNQNIKKIILTDPMGFTVRVPWRYKVISIELFSKFLITTIKRITKKNMKSFLESAVYEKSNIKEEFIDYFYQCVRGNKHHPFTLINRLSGFFKIRKELVLISELSKIKQPTLIIIGDKDPLIRTIDIKHRYSLIPNAKLEIILNAGHVPNLENSKDFNQLCVKFLKG